MQKLQLTAIYMTFGLEDKSGKRSNFTFTHLANAVFIQRNLR